MSVAEYIAGAFLLFVSIISILNLTAGLISGVWLLFEGQFYAVVVGLLYGLFGHYIWGFVLLITLVVGLPGAKFFEKKQYVPGFIFLTINQLLLIGIIYFSVMYVFGVAVQLTEYASLVPVFLFAYATSFAPWAFMANEEKKSGNHNAGIMIITGQIGLVLGILLMFISGQGAWVSGLFLLGLIGGTVLNIIPVIGEMNMKKEMDIYEQQ